MSSSSSSGSTFLNKNTSEPFLFGSVGSILNVPIAISGSFNSGSTQTVYSSVLPAGVYQVNCCNLLFEAQTGDLVIGASYQMDSGLPQAFFLSYNGIAEQFFQISPSAALYSNGINASTVQVACFTNAGTWSIGGSTGQSVLNIVKIA